MNVRPHRKESPRVVGNIDIPYTPGSKGKDSAEFSINLLTNRVISNDLGLVAAMAYTTAARAG